MSISLYDDKKHRKHQLKMLIRILDYQSTVPHYHIINFAIDSFNNPDYLPFNT